MSDFQRLPLQDEVSKYDPRYIADMKLAYTIYSHQRNSSAVMQLFEAWESHNKDPEATTAHMNMVKDQIRREKESAKRGVNRDMAERQNAMYSE